MPALYDSPFTSSLGEWSNFSGTVGRKPLPVVVTPPPFPNDMVDAVGLAAQSKEISALLTWALQQTPPEPIRSQGSKYSFSSIIRPNRVLLDTANMSAKWKVLAADLTVDYQISSQANQAVPLYMQGGVVVSELNRWLGEDGLALQTSGAGNGHRIAGCIATGTHGSAIGIGAVHDTVLGVHLIVAPNEAVFVHSATNNVFEASFAASLTNSTGITTNDVADDELFGAALVSLGSLGVVFGVVLETVPLYRLERQIIVRERNDPGLWNAIRTLDVSELDPARGGAPHHVEVVFNPYPLPGAASAYVTLMWRTSTGGLNPVNPAGIVPQLASDTMSLLAAVIQNIDGMVPGEVTTAVISAIIAGQLESRYALSPEDAVKFPGAVFGPTSLPPGSGASTEIVVDQSHIEATLATIFDTLASEAEHGRHLLGAVALRFVPASRALLGMNTAPMSCFIELPSIRNTNVTAIYTRIWNALEAAGIPFTCHWGQLHGLNAGRVNRYFGARAARWRAARAKLLGPAARAVFAAPLLAEVGLG